MDMTDLTVGAKAPVLKLSLSRDDVIAEGAVPPGDACTVFFFPRIGSATCNDEVLAFARAHAAFRETGLGVIGISPDPAARLARFREKHGIPFPLAADPALEAARAWGVWVEKRMYGRAFMGVERATFLLDTKGRIAAAWRKVRLDGHVEAVLAAAAALAAR